MKLWSIPSSIGSIYHKNILYDHDNIWNYDQYLFVISNINDYIYSCKLAFVTIG